MFRACLAQSSRCIAPSVAPCSSLHTSALLHAQVSRKSVARGVKKLNNLRKEERFKKAQATRPSVVLGTRPGDDAKWANCDLAKVLVDEEELIASTELVPTKQPVGTVFLPKQMGFGVGEVEKRMLFKELPELSSTVKTLRHAQAAHTRLQSDSLREIEEVAKKELQKANLFAKLLDLRNASAGGIAYENRRRIITAFSTPQNPFDPGRSEVQAALLTYQIRNLWKHLTTFRRDVGNRLGLRKLIHQRAKILKYLKRKDINRYETILQRLALEPESVEGELVV
ncbi:30S ribosomal protein S15 [Hypsizygus marmoreus]|uniref:30S ribosomal protein S15 n=1 Tax=Hypsizygus marmoreus TaxID=39966 RepID=A0A369K1P3_HYPMA|nr:30S ribosomal protein S15 [Hypsizygus marmoreus]